MELANIGDYLGASFSYQYTDMFPGFSASLNKDWAFLMYKVLNCLTVVERESKAGAGSGEWEGRSSNASSYQGARQEAIDNARFTEKYQGQNAFFYSVCQLTRHRGSLPWGCFVKRSVINPYVHNPLEFAGRFSLYARPRMDGDDDYHSDGEYYYNSGNLNIPRGIWTGLSAVDSSDQYVFFPTLDIGYIPAEPPPSTAEWPSGYGFYHSIYSASGSPIINSGDGSSERGFTALANYAVEGGFKYYDPPEVWIDL